ncbi:multidrug resistance efflux pump [Xylanibacter oryzae DSM 17970]|uniref:Multidrug resistance efflux pump n=1 Tax=Xylanibacter oryzae DSM 17970 TaxID=915438 RepID=A0ABN0RUB4_9BACT|nr:HlyD family efflux transporter periplasmic adaptor subunit [Xylanibacter oryzae]EXG77831.1 multidrug resistance efflux pump [Xylanibacter oryzae DSM 17970]
MKTNCLIILAAALIMTACSDKENKFDATGTFEATEVTVSAQENGCLLSFNIDEGSKVSVGNQVGLIDTVQLQLKARQLGATRQSFASQRPNTQAQIAATRQQLAKAIQEQHRFESLVKDDAANRKQLDDALSNVRVLQRQLEAQVSSLGNSTQSLNSQMSATEIQKYQVLDQLSKCHITTPITGVVLDKYVEQGEFVTTGKPLFKVADTDNMFLRAYITSAQLSMVKLGQHVKVYSDYGDNKGRQYQGTVTWISSRSEFTPKTILNEDERADLVYAVKIAVKNDGYVKIGMYGRVKLN